MSTARNYVAALTASSILASSLLSVPLAAQERVEIGNAATVVGDVELSNDQLRRPRDVERRDRIAWGDLIDTGRRSQLQIMLLDRSTFGIGARSRVRIDRFVYDPEEGRSLFATFVRGALRFFSGRQEGENSAEIQTPSGRIGIRGTALDVLVGENAEEIAEDENAVGNVRSDEDEATLVVLRGPGPETVGGLTTGLAEIEAGGVTVVLDTPGLAAYVPRNGAAPIGPFQMSNAGLAQLQEQLAPEVARAANSSGGGGFFDDLLPLAVGAAVIGGIILLDGDGDVPVGGPTLYDGDDDNYDDDDVIVSDPCEQLEGGNLVDCQGDNSTAGGDAETPPNPNTTTIY